MSLFQSGDYAVSVFCRSGKALRSSEVLRLRYRKRGNSAMMYLKRKIDSYLKDWYRSSNKKPLIIRGARQIGKTESI